MVSQGLEPILNPNQELFDLAFRSARDPDNAGAIADGGYAVTSVHSEWLHRRCIVCGHTFRVGDPVRIRERGIVLHDSVTLPCAEARESAAADTPSQEVVLAFFAGLDSAWPPAAGVKTVVLAKGHPLLSPPTGAFGRKKCLVCSHTFRPLDQVVTCPCSPMSPLCAAAVHRDPEHGLPCLESWNPGVNQQVYCPVTSRLLADMLRGRDG